MGMWIEPDVFKRMSGEQHKAHNEKVRTMRKAKKSKSTLVIPAPATARVPETYAMAAAQQTPQQPQHLDQPLESQFPNGAPRVFSYKGVTYRAAVANRTYEAQTKLLTSGSLVDSGCNGGVAGSDVLILEEHSFGEVDIVGVGDNIIRGVPLCTAAGLLQTTKGPVIAIMHQYAALKTGGSLHSPLQMRDHGVIIDDTPSTQCRFDGEYGGQMIQFPSMNRENSHDLPLSIWGGLAYFTMRPPTVEELNDEAIPHVHITSDIPWDPSKYDEETSQAAMVQAAYSADVVDEDRMAYDCEVFMNALMRDIPIDLEEADEADDEFIELQSADESTDSTTVQSNSIFEIPLMVPNVVEAVASVCRSVQAKLTHIEHRYGKMLEQLRPNLHGHPLSQSRPPWMPQRSSTTLPSGQSKSSNTFGHVSREPMLHGLMRQCALTLPTWSNLGTRMESQDTEEPSVSSCL
jgi:hypothetical protein